MVDEFFFKLTPAYVLSESVVLWLIAVNCKRNPGNDSTRDPVPFGIK